MGRSYQHAVASMGFTLGYFKKEDGGNCQGLTMAWLNACISGKEKHFNHLVSEIVNNPRVVIGKIEDLKEKIAKREREPGPHEPLTAEDEEGFQFIALFDEITLYQHPGRHAEIFGESLSQTDVQNISEVASSDSMPDVYSEAGIFTKNEFSNYLQDIATIIDAMDYKEGEIIGFNLNSHNHAVGFTYDTKNKCFTVMDINQGETKTFDAKDVKGAAGMIMKGLQVNQVAEMLMGLKLTQISSLQYAGVNARLITTSKDPQKLVELKSQFESLKKSHVITPAVAQRTGMVNLAFIAAANNDTDVLKQLAKQGADLNRPDRSGRTPAWIAVYNGNTEALEILAEHKAILNRPDSSGRLPALQATINGDAKTLQILADHHTDLTVTSNGINLASTAAQLGHAEVLKVLAATNKTLLSMPSNGITPATDAAANGHAQALQVLAEHVDLNTASSNGFTPTYMAAQNGHTDAMKVLAANGADLNLPSNGIRPAYIAAQQGHKDVLNVLAANGVDLNIPCNGITPAYAAAQNGHSDALNVLAANGADLNLPCNGITPAFAAAQNGHADVLNVLAQNGVDLSTPCLEGMITPAHIAAAYGQTKALVALAQHDATLFNRMDINGKTPIQILMDQGRIDILSELAKHGVEPDRIEKYILQAECNAILDQIKVDGEICPGTAKDDKMSNYISAKKQEISEADLDTLKDLKQELHDVHKGLEDIPELKRMIQSFRDDSKFWTTGMQDKAQKIEEAIMAVSVPERIDIDPIQLRTKAQLPILESLAAHRHANKPKEVLSVEATGHITAIDPARAFEQFKQFKDQLRKAKTEDKAKQADLSPADEKPSADNRP